MGPGAVLAIVAMAGWGVSYVPSAWLVEDWPPLLAAAARLGLGGLILVGALAAARRPLWPAAGAPAVVVLALTQTALFYGATFWGIAHGGAGLAAVLANTDPLFVAGLSAVFLGERLVGRQWAGLVVGLVGATVVVWEGPLWPPEVSPAALVVVGGALAWAIGTVVASRRMRARAEPLALAGWQMILGAGMLAVVGAIAEGGPRTTGPGTAALILFTALAGSALPFALFYMALQRGGAAMVSAWFFLIPVIGVLTAWPLLGEDPSTRLWVGMAAVSVGLWMVLAPPGGERGRLVHSPPPP